VILRALERTDLYWRNLKKVENLPVCIYDSFHPSKIDSNLTEKDKTHSVEVLYIIYIRIIERLEVYLVFENGRKKIQTEKREKNKKKTQGTKGI